MHHHLILIQPILPVRYSLCWRVNVHFRAVMEIPIGLFRYLSPARMRLSDQYLVARAMLTPDELSQKVNPPLTETELAFNLNQSRFMIRPYDAPQDTQLLTRSLSVAAGGIYHAPNGDIFHSKKGRGLSPYPGMD